MPDLSSFEPWLQFFTQDPTLRLMQAGLLLGSSILVFFVFYATRDILLRTHSLIYQILCILIVACLPIIGFLVYLLIRPARTVKQREIEAMLKKLTGTDKKTEIKSAVKQAHD